jgi:hypothetical protein
MVVTKVETVRREMEKRGWGLGTLSDNMGVCFGTVRAMMAGQGVSAKTQMGLFEAFDRKVPFEELFELAPGPEAEDEAEDEDAAEGDGLKARPTQIGTEAAAAAAGGGTE